MIETSEASVLVRADTAKTGDNTGVYIVTLNRPGRLNALTEPLGESFSEALRDLSQRPDLRAVVLTGAGRAFSSGGDLDFLEERAASSAQANSERMRAFYRRFLAVRELPVPVVAAVNGPAIGAGLCLALACDLRVAARYAKLGFTFVKLGLHPGMAASFLLPALVGHQVASRLLLTGDVIDGEEAERLGLVAEAVDSGEVLPRATDLARRMAEAAPVAVRSCVRSLRLGSELDLERALWREADAQAHCYGTEDLQEGIGAIKERRAPRFSGR